ncbi:MAG: (cytosine-5-)-methyltransferase [Verrucomicrobiales bacterium]|nr:(cytosine-5-)-methyltransferase [Verrucomicrobiales bacterium]
MKSLELFSGAGGLAKGLELSGFDHSAFVEFNADACDSLRRNFDPKKVFEGDIRDFDFTKLSGIDIVAGGPPCQPFSLGGKHGANNDSRDMFPYAIKAIETLVPKAFVFENVKGLLRESFSDYFRYILLRLTYPDAHPGIKATWEEHFNRLQKINFNSYDGIKYKLTHTLVNAADYGIPQCRERVAIVGVRSDLDATWKFPQPTHSEERLLWDKFISGSYWERHEIPKKDRENCVNGAQLKVKKLRDTFGFFEPELKPWQTVRDALKLSPDPRTKHGLADHNFRDGAKSYAGHTGSELDWTAKTIKAGGHGVPGGENMIRFPDGSVRYFTVYEAKLIQTFPDDFVIVGAWGEALRQIGNAVPVTLGEAIGRALHDTLSTKNRNLNKKGTPKIKPETKQPNDFAHITA